MKRLLLAAAFGLMALAPASGDDTVDNAFALCSLVDGTGMASKPCEVDGWGGAVKVHLDMASGEARETCSMMAKLMRERGKRFESRWKLEIYSPYSGSNAIAYCSLSR